MKKLILALFFIQAITVLAEELNAKDTIENEVESLEEVPVPIIPEVVMPTGVKHVEAAADSRSSGGYGGGRGGGGYGGGTGKGTSLLVKGSMCACHKCDCEKGQINHCSSGGYVKGGGGRPFSVEKEEGIRRIRI